MIEQTAIRELMMNRETIFFRPTDGFWDALSTIPWRWKRYVDAGAGVGLLTKLMRERGYCVDAVDAIPCRSPLVPDIEHVDLTGLGVGGASLSGVDFQVNDCMIFARPSHGGFLSLSIPHYMDIGEILYIGLARNVERDLDGLTYSLMAEGVGEDGESMWRVIGWPHRLQEFRLIRVHPRGPASWWLYKPHGHRYVNTAGGGFTSEDVDVISSTMVGHDGMVYTPPEGMLLPELASGWLAPDGTWYGCGSSQHETVAYSVIGSSTPVLERIGFARCYGDTGLSSMLWTLGRRFHDDERRRATPEQARALIAMGYSMRDEGLVSDEDFDL